MLIAGQHVYEPGALGHKVLNLMAIDRSRHVGFSS
jgi:hypothetical protein